MTTKEETGLTTIDHEKAIAEITTKDIQQYICPKANPAEIGLFLKVCIAEKLNPFLKEIYLVKYSENEPASIITSIQAWEKAAENDPNYQGHQAGIIVRVNGQLQNIEGAFVEDWKTVVGGWAKVYRKDRKVPFYFAISVQEAAKQTREGKLTKFWSNMLPSMIRTAALRRDLKEAFPNRMRNLTEEDATDAEYKEIPEGTLPASFMDDGKPAWDRFWAKQKERGIDKDSAHAILGVETLKGMDLEKAHDDITVWITTHRIEQAKSDLFDNAEQTKKIEAQTVPKINEKPPEAPGAVSTTTQGIDDSPDEQAKQEAWDKINGLVNKKHVSENVIITARLVALKLGTTLEELKTAKGKAGITLDQLNAVLDEWK